MKRKYAILVLVLLVTSIPILLFLDERVEQSQIHSLHYPDKGISFVTDRLDKVISLSISEPRHMEREKETREKQLFPSPDILPGIGVGGARIGDPEEQIIEALGKPRNRWGIRKEDTSLLYKNPNLYFAFRNGKLTRITITKNEGKTLEGLGIGNTKEEIIKAYGMPSEGYLYISVIAYFATFANCIVISFFMGFAFFLLVRKWGNKRLFIKISMFSVFGPLSYYLGSTIASLRHLPISIQEILFLFFPRSETMGEFSVYYLDSFVLGASILLLFLFAHILKERIQTRKSIHRHSLFISLGIGGMMGGMGIMRLLTLIFVGNPPLAFSRFLVSLSLVPLIYLVYLAFTYLIPKKSVGTLEFVQNSPVEKS